MSVIIVRTGKVKRRELFMIFHGTRIWCYEKVVKQQIKRFSVGMILVFLSLSLEFLAGVLHLPFFHLFSCSTQPLLTKSL